jgi:hypothetical protein
MLITPVDITGDGTAQPLASTPTLCGWFQVSVVSNVSGIVIRLGFPNVSATQGIPIGGGLSGGNLLPQATFSATFAKPYDLSQIKHLTPSGDVIALAYGG